jgi:lipoprotein-releasing system permease protein
VQIPWFIAVSFLRQYRAQAWLTMTAVSVGVAVMVFLSALITGLQQSLIRQTLGTQPHITLRPVDEEPTPQRKTDLIVRRTQKATQRVQTISEWQRVLSRLDEDASVSATSPLATGSAFAVRGTVNRPVVIMGVNPEQFEPIIAVGKHVVIGRYHLSGSEAAIGTELARNLGITVGDKVRINTPEGGDALVTVQAIFDLGNQQVNQRWIVMPLRTGQSLLGFQGGVNVIHVKVDGLFEAEDIAKRISGNMGLDAASWMKENEQLLVALKSQSSSSYTIQFFVFLAVAMGIASVLVVSVVQRTREIGILRAMGMPRSQISLVFLIQGALIGLFGSLIGCGFGTALAHFFSRIARAPDGSPTFPMSLTLELFLAATALATLTGILAAALPARRAAQLDPVEAIRYG